MYQQAQRSNELYHYGKKGMRWGQHIFARYLDRTPRFMNRTRPSINKSKGVTAYALKGAAKTLTGRMPNAPRMMNRRRSIVRPKGISPHAIGGAAKTLTGRLPNTPRFYDRTKGIKRAMNKMRKLKYSKLDKLKYGRTGRSIANSTSFYKGVMSRSVSTATKIYDRYKR